MTPAVWMVDDDEDDLNFMRMAFRQASPSIEVLTISHSATLLANLNASARLPQLILLDVNMPLINGLELLAQMRRIPEYTQLPVVMLTTSSSSLDQARSYSLGANGFFIKPVRFQELSAIAQELSQQWALR